MNTKLKQSLKRILIAVTFFGTLFAGIWLTAPQSHADAFISNVWRDLGTYVKTAGSPAKDVGASSDRIPNGYFTNIDATTGNITTLTVSPAVTGLTQGSSLFAGAGSVISQDNANYFYDATNHRLGIGNAAPGAQLDLGLAGTTQGALRMAGSVSGNVTITPANTAGTWTLTLPATGGSNGQALTTNGSGTASWTTVTTAPAGSNTQLQFNNSAAFGASANLTFVSPTLTVGNAGSATGALALAGSTSGTVTVQPANAAGTWTLTLPITGGSNGQFLQTDGSGTSTWATVTATPGGSNTQVQYNSTGSLAANSGFTYNGTSQINLGVAGASKGTIVLAGNTSGTATLVPTAAAGGVTITLPATTGTVITTGDTGTVTNGMLAGSIAASKLVGTDIATVGTITSGTWSGTAIAVTKGGTGLTSTTTNQILYSSGTSTIAGLATANNGVLLTSGAGVPSIGTVSSNLSIASSSLDTVQGIQTSSTPQFARIGLGAAADSNHLLLLSNGTITTDKHLIDAAGTWNAAGVTFTGIKENITNTASAAGSKLVDLQIGGNSNFSVDKTATLALGNATTGNTGQINLLGLTSGTVTLNVASAAGTYTLTLPTTAGSANQFLQTNGSGVTTWASATSTPTVNINTNFETSGRFSNSVGGSGSNTFNSVGYNCNSGSTGTSFAKSIENISNAGSYFAGSPAFSTQIEYTDAVNITGDRFLGIGNITVTGSSIDFTSAHIGFKIVSNGTTTSVFATQADGTETASSALITVAQNDTLDLILKVNGTSSVDYYWRQNGGALSSATNLTTHLPTSTSTAIWSSACSNHATANNVSFIAHAASYSR